MLRPFAQGFNKRKQRDQQACIRYLTCEVGLLNPIRAIIEKVTSTKAREKSVACLPLQRRHKTGNMA